ncbi:MAG: tetratricopeptide repeat protein [Leptolyngbyaceae cyanobacterium bins.59]|nr:tetratricopeptide repeat protein [Leptolyngbyaceae cyanobacterium bins.59]
MMDPSIQALLEDLKSPEENTRDRATEELWRLWFEQKGVYGLEILRRSQMFLEAGQPDRAEALLNELIQYEPDFAEALNRRAVLYYMQGNYFKAISDCKEVVRLNPIHFGAWHGLGLCYACVGRYSDAIKAFHKALEIQPYAVMNQRLILECTAKLS